LGLRLGFGLGFGFGLGLGLVRWGHELVDPTAIASAR
jgi:ABC-type nitrate/sulfonate/bicarbonate transport system permease component